MCPKRSSISRRQDVRGRQEAGSGWPSLLDVSGSTFATRAEEIVAARSFLDNITRSTVTGVFGIH